MSLAAGVQRYYNFSLSCNSLSAYHDADLPLQRSGQDLKNLHPMVLDNPRNSGVEASLHPS
jgi:hypothetical protein